MPYGDKCVKRVPHHVHNLAFGVPGGVWQGPRGHVRAHEAGPWQARHVRDLGICEEFVLKERNEVVGVGGEQGVVGLVVRVAPPIHDGEAHGFQPCGAGFGDGGDYDISVLCNVVFLHGNYGLNLFWLAPKVLVEIDIWCSPTSLFWECDEQFFAFWAYLFFINSHSLSLSLSKS